MKNSFGILFLCLASAGLGIGGTFYVTHLQSNSHPAGEKEGPGTKQNLQREKMSQENVPTLPKRVVSPLPLDPLNKAELAAAIDILKTKGKLDESTYVALLTLKEPAKKVVLDFQKGNSIDRKAYAVLFHRRSNTTYEAVVDLSKKNVTSWTERKDAQPALLAHEYKLGDELMRADKRWQDAMAKRDINPKDVQLDMWAFGGRSTDKEKQPNRLCRMLCYWRGGRDNAMGSPIEGVSAVIDLTAEKVVEVLDRGTITLPKGKDDFFDPNDVGQLRKRLNPLLYSQPEGANYAIHGHEIRWNDWRFRYALHPREGLVLYLVGYEDQGKVRPILYRASMSEMVVPYGDPHAEWNWRAAFDQGEYGVGGLTNQLRPGIEIPNHGQTFDAEFVDDFGKPMVFTGAVGIYEQDGGILWRHYDDIGGKTASRRARELVLCHMFTVGNYDYIMNWIFHEDGTLEARVGLTGILLAKGTGDTDCASCKAKPDKNGKIVSDGGDRYGTMVGKNVVAVNHQHFLNFRLDFMVDGVKNSVRECDAVAMPLGQKGLVDPGNAFVLQETPLTNEKMAFRHANSKLNRHWKIFNASKPNEIGHFPSYLLEPGPDARAFFTKKAVVAKRGQFAQHAFRVTRHKSDENYAGGDYPNLSPGGDGVTKYANDGENLEQQDLVVWYTAGITHIPRPEEWPVMATTRLGFKLKPHGFFLRNPALNVPGTPKE
ncbi:MAG: primary-amine oxidase [Gemmataceae bacterium]